MGIYLQLLRQLPTINWTNYQEQVRVWHEQIGVAKEKGLRVLVILSQQPGETGSGVFLKETIHQLHAMGHDVYLLAAHYRTLTQQDFPSLEDYRIKTLIFSDQNNAHLAEVSFPIPSMSPDMPYHHIQFQQLSEEQLEEYCEKWIEKIRSIVESVNPHLIHVNHLWLLPGITQIAAPWLPIVATAHGTAKMLLEAHPKFGELVRPPAQNLDAVMAVSASIAEGAIRSHGVSPERVSVVGNGFNPELFKIITGDEPQVALSRLLARYPDLPNWDKLVLYVGKFASYKGLPYLIRAARRYSEMSEYSVLTVIAGSGSETLTSELQELIKSLSLQNRVLMVGKLNYEEVASVMNSADLFVLPSVFEPFGLVLLEALACGIRSVAALQGGPAYFVPKTLIDRNLVTLIPPLEVNSAFEPKPEDAERYTSELAAAIVQQLQQSTIIANREAIAYSVQDYTWRNCAKRIEAVYYEVIDEHLKRRISDENSYNPRLQS